MDWLRSEDLKEEKNVTAPRLSIAVHALCRSRELARPSVGPAPDESRLTSTLTSPIRSVTADILLRQEPDEEENEEEDEGDDKEEGDEESDEGYSE
jgi:hypothetical protein